MCLTNNTPPDIALSINLLARYSSLIPKTLKQHQAYIQNLQGTAVMVCYS